MKMTIIFFLAAIMAVSGCISQTTSQKIPNATSPVTPVTIGIPGGVPGQLYKIGDKIAYRPYNHLTNTYPSNDNNVTNIYVIYAIDLNMGPYWIQDAPGYTKTGNSDDIMYLSKPQNIVPGDRRIAQSELIPYQLHYISCCYDSTGTKIG